MGVGDFEAAEEAVDVGGVGGFGDADVDLGGGVGGDDVGAGSAGDDAAVDGELSAEVGEAGDGLDEPGEFEDGGVAVVEVDTAMGSDSGHVECVLADTFAGGLVGESLGGLEDEDGGGGAGEALGDGTGDGAADLFFTVEQKGDGAGDFELLEGADGGEGHDDAGFHVEDSGAGVAAVVVGPGHGGEGTEGPDGVEMAEEEDGFAGGAGGAEAEFEDVAEEFLGVAFDAAAEFAGPGFGE